MAVRPEWHEDQDVVAAGQADQTGQNEDYIEAHAGHYGSLRKWKTLDSTIIKRIYTWALSVPLLVTQGRCFYCGALKHPKTPSLFFCRLEVSEKAGLIMTQTVCLLYLLFVVVLISCHKCIL